MKSQQFNGRKIPVSEVLSKMDESTLKYKSEFFDGAEVNIGMLNLRLFKSSGTDCVHCNLKGEYFRVEKMGFGSSIFNEWHLNLYGINARNEEVLLTKDHIIPRSKGGTDDLRNLQPMCEVCNKRKDSMPMEQFVAKYSGIKVSDRTKYDGYRDKTIKRMLERYGETITDADFEEMCKLAQNSRIIADLGNSKTIREIIFKERSIKVMYCTNYKAVLSAMQDESDDYFLHEMVPKFAKDDQERARVLYHEIMSTCLSEFKTFPEMRDTAKYFQSCQYPKVLFDMLNHKDDKKRLSGAVWGAVRRRMAALETEMQRV